MRLLLAALLTAASMSAFADGVDLTYLPAPSPLTTAEQQSVAAVSAGFPDTVVTAMNAAALDSTVVNVTIAGTVYRLVGVKTARADMPNTDLWDGSVDSGVNLTRASLVRYNGAVLGYINVKGTRYRIAQINTRLGVTQLVPSRPTQTD